MSLRARLLSVTLLLALVLPGIVVTASFEAYASSCTVSESPHDFVTEAWYGGGSVQGLRAPITLRGSAVCDSTGTLSASWEFVAVQGNSIYGGAGIVQIGWGKLEGNGGPCKFFWYSRGDSYYHNPQVDYWDCNPSLGQTQYFKIDTSGSKFGMYDCGTGGWSTCSVALPDFAQSDWTTSSIFAWLGSEVNYPPDVDMMGSQANPGQYNPIKGERSSDGWQTRSLTFSGANHPRYHSPVHTDTDLQAYSS